MNQDKTSGLRSEESIPNVSPSFNQTYQTLRRDWGEESILVCASKKYTLKLLKIRAGCGGGLQFHRKKDEAGYIVSGRLIISYTENGVLQERMLVSGEHFHFPPGCIHREYAIEDTIVLEASTPHMNDRVRVEEYFGLERFSSLPSTDEAEIQEL